MKAERWKKTESVQSGQWNHFPNSTEARYEQLSQTITLNTITSEYFEEALRSKDPIVQRRVLPVLYHELRHWIEQEV
jgi:hypothetical protein